MSFASFNLQNILPWVVVALAVVMLVSILAKCFSIYRNIKKNRTYVKRDGESKKQMLTIRGEYFVLSCDGEFSVGENGQLKAGKYLLRGDGYDKFQLTVNGETKELDGDSEVTFLDGDTVTPVTCNVLIKPMAGSQGETNENV